MFNRTSQILLSFNYNFVRTSIVREAIQGNLVHLMFTNNYWAVHNMTLNTSIGYNYSYYVSAYNRFFSCLLGHVVNGNNSCVAYHSVCRIQSDLLYL